MLKRIAPVVFLACLFLLSLGCSSSSDTRLVIKNDSMGPIVFTFRASDYELAPGAELTDSIVVPNGAYSYSTIVAFPDAKEYTLLDEGGLSGVLTFHHNNRVLIAYSSFITTSGEGNAGDDDTSGTPTPTPGTPSEMTPTPGTPSEMTPTTPSGTTPTHTQSVGKAKPGTVKQGPSAEGLSYTYHVQAAVTNTLPESVHQDQ